MESAGIVAQLAETPLHDWHASHGGRMVDFAGWSMPVQYTSIITEHQATRTSAGLFDVSHMGRLRFDGPGAAAFLERLVTRSVADQSTGQIRYALVTNDEGGILDDVLVYRLEDHKTAKPYHLMVVNASNRHKILDWIEKQKPDASVKLTDLTTRTAMIAVQGPRAVELLRPITGDLSSWKYYTGREISVAGTPGIVSRTGYTGEDGFELIVDTAAAVPIWEALINSGATAAGLGSRDTLRLEAAMPLYGHELNEQVDPLTAGLGFAVDLPGREFPGRDRLAQIKADGLKLSRVGLELVGKRPTREGDAVIAAGRTVGKVTSGSFSPTLGRPIAMAYVPREFATVGGELAVDIRGRAEAARVVKLPFYRRSK